mgnify:CR=1 FL=1
MFIDRQLSAVIVKACKNFPAIVLTGPRQSGKTTLLKHLFKGKASFVTLDSPEARTWANDDPENFLDSHATPFIIDEIQNAPNILPYIKSRIDNNRKTGQWILTGSQEFSVMKNVSESLAGRIATLRLLPFSFSETKKHLFKNWKEYFHDMVKQNSGRKNLAAIILNGSYPEIIAKKNTQTNLWYESYIQTYLEKDLKVIYDIGNLNLFVKFLRLLANRTGQILNMNSLANDLGTSIPTVKKWISILDASGIIYLLQPYYKNNGKRLIKSPKIYFLDTGLVAHLTGIRTEEALLKGPLADPLFETFVISEFVKQFYHIESVTPPMYYINNKNLWEIDLVLDMDGELTPIEIKLASTVMGRHLQNFQKIRNTYKNVVKSNYLICNQKDPLLKQNTQIIYWGNL